MDDEARDALTTSHNALGRIVRGQVLTGCVTTMPPYAQAMSVNDPIDLPEIGRPATAALASVGIIYLDGAAAYGRENLAELHGVGPKALRLLDEAISRHGLTWPDQ